MKEGFPELSPQIKVKKLTRVYIRRLAKIRIIVKHTFSRIIGEEFRNRLKNYDVMTNIILGLRIMGA
ncbi:MAG: hypothetical protein QXK57_02700 [Conexivisphaerales archaeon]